MGNSHQQIFYGAPGTGKSHAVKSKTEDAETAGRVVRTTFHPDSDYSTFVGAYKPAMKGENIIYAFRPQAFTNAYVQAWNTNEDVYLIIEEINRGNCAQIFGDLFQLLDRNDDGFSEYPIEADADLQNYLQKELKREDIPDNVKSGEKLMLPNNLYIWATMNTSDQSLFPIDSAFKRRWDWYYVPISKGKEDWEIDVNGTRYDWWDFLQKINDKIASTTNSEDKKLGYYFCKADKNVIDAETFVGKVIFYLWNDVFKDFVDDANNPFKLTNDTLLSFDTFYQVEDGETKVVEESMKRFLDNLGVGNKEDEDDEGDDGAPNRKRTISTITYQGKTFSEANMTQFDIYIETLKEIGIQTVGPMIEKMKYYRKGSKMATKTPVETLEKDDRFSYVQVEDYYFVKGANPSTLIIILEQLKKELQLDMTLKVR